MIFRVKMVPNARFRLVLPEEGRPPLDLWSAMSVRVEANIGCWRRLIHSFLPISVNPFESTLYPFFGSREFRCDPILLSEVPGHYVLGICQIRQARLHALIIPGFHSIKIPTNKARDRAV